jgi:hypothetical protein
MKGIGRGKEGVKLSIFADGKILYLKERKVSNPKLSDLMNIFGK